MLLLNKNLSIKDTELKRKCSPHTQILSTCYISRLMVTIGFKSVANSIPLAIKSPSSSCERLSLTYTAHVSNSEQVGYVINDIFSYLILYFICLFKYTESLFVTSQNLG